MSAVVEFQRESSSLPAELNRIESALSMATTPAEVNQVIALMDAAVAYAKRFYKDQQDVIQRAKGLRLRAECRLGEMLKAMPKVSNLRRGPEVPQENSGALTLTQLGIDKKTSMRAQRLASLPVDKFEAVATGRVALSEVMAPMKKSAPRISPANKRRIEEIDAAKARGISMLCTYARLTLTALRSQSTFTDEEQLVIQELAEAVQQVGEFQG